jgi:uncharacterized protein (TIGR03083 family)
MANDAGDNAVADASQWISALRASHDRLVGIATGLGPEEVRAPSYCDEWTIAQVLSHLGSGAEIHLANLEAMLTGSVMPSREDYQQIWDRWNAKSPEAMAADALEADARHLERFEGLSDDELDRLAWDFMGRMLDAAGIVAMRLSEHAAHTFDVEVSLDPAAVVPQRSAALLVDLLPSRAARLARGERPAAAPVEIAIETTGPERAFALAIADEVSLTPGTRADAMGSCSLPAEAFFRLLYGRLDADHTPDSVRLEGPVSLEELRALFPGF